MKMVDRLFPGSSVNSFLNQNGILKGMGDGEVKRLEDVASVSVEEKNELINPIPPTIPVTTNDVIEHEEEQITESYNCPCKKCNKPANNIKEVWDKFSSPEQKDTFKAGRTPQNYIESIDKFAENVKRKLTGGDKQSKNAIEGFCNENWHDVAISIIIVIVVVFIAISVTIIVFFIDGYNKCCISGTEKTQNFESLTGGVVF